MTKPPGPALTEEYTGCEDERVMLDERMWIICIFRMSLPK
jgi:hypothetical protein